MPTDPNLARISEGWHRLTPEAQSLMVDLACFLADLTPEQRARVVTRNDRFTFLPGEEGARLMERVNALGKGKADAH